MIWEFQGLTWNMLWCLSFWFSYSRLNAFYIFVLQHLMSFKFTGQIHYIKICVCVNTYGYLWTRQTSDVFSAWMLCTIYLSYFPSLLCLSAPVQNVSWDTGRCTRGKITLDGHFYSLLWFGRSSFESGISLLMCPWMPQKKSIGKYGVGNKKQLWRAKSCMKMYIGHTGNGVLFWLWWQSWTSLKSSTSVGWNLNASI